MHYIYFFHFYIFSLSFLLFPSTCVLLNTPAHIPPDHIVAHRTCAETYALISFCLSFLNKKLSHVWQHRVYTHVGVHTHTQSPLVRLQAPVMTPPTDVRPTPLASWLLTRSKNACLPFLVGRVFKHTRIHTLHTQYISLFIHQFEN